MNEIRKRLTTFVVVLLALSPTFLIPVTVKANFEGFKVNYFDKSTGQLSQQDMVVLGGITEEDIESYGKSWQQSLPQTVSNQLLSGNRGILYFYRAMDRIGALVDTHLIL